LNTEFIVEKRDMSPKKVKLTSKQREKLLRNIWLLHDGRWLLKSAEEFGFDAATKLNFTVQESIGKTETKQLLDETGYGEIENIDDFKALFDLTSLLYTPEGHNTEFKIIDKSTIILYTWNCYVHKMVSKAGNLHIHQCSSMVRCDSWLKGMSLDGEVTRDKNINNCNGACEIIFKIKWQQKGKDVKKEVHDGN
jgi:hypothetical protein